MASLIINQIHTCCTHFLQCMLASWLITEFFSNSAESSIKFTSSTYFQTLRMKKRNDLAPAVTQSGPSTCGKTACIHKAIYCIDKVLMYVVNLAICNFTYNNNIIKIEFFKVGFCIVFNKTNKTNYLQYYTKSTKRNSDTTKLLKTVFPSFSNSTVAVLLQLFMHLLKEQTEVSLLLPFLRQFHNMLPRKIKLSFPYLMVSLRRY